MKSRSEITSSLKRVADDAREAFGSLSAEQLNWRPSEKSWSVAQCFDHLITTHSLYFPIFERLTFGSYRRSAWAGISPFSGFFGRFLVRSLDPGNVKPMKTTGKARPSSSDIGSDIIDRFGGHQEKLAAHISLIPGEIDSAKTVITSPLMSFVTYSLADALELIDVHCKRHFGQARRVTESTGFPG